MKGAEEGKRGEKAGLWGEGKEVEREEEQDPIPKGVLETFLLTPNVGPVLCKGASLRRLDKLEVFFSHAS